MSIIYQIRNKINDKKYIGMTTRDLNIRKKEHQKVYNDPESRMYNFKIYNAMRKYGFDNFEFSILEECDKAILEEREKYYIELYNTRKNGYNEALGGFGKTLLTDKQISASKTLYDNGWLLQDIAEVFKSSPKTIGKKIRDRYNLNTKRNSDVYHSKKIIGINNEKEMNFNSMTDAAKYIIENELTKSDNLTSVISKISGAIINNKHTAYGFKWRLNN
jgi:group I intron endonuclease